MLFPLFTRTFSFTIINLTNENLTGYYQKLFFTNISHLNGKDIKNIVAFDNTDIGGTVNVDGQTFQPFDTIKDTQKAYLYLVDDNDDIILNRFPINELRLANQSATSKRYQFKLKNINWLKSYVIKTDTAFIWDKNKGLLFTVYW